jgi:hypothetical protein
MKKVATGAASPEELEHFQTVIQQITAENKAKGVGPGPSPDRLLVDGKTIRYFAEEVRVILGIVYASNPKQTSADLRPPAGSDPLVVQLVREALDRADVRDMIHRIAEDKPQFSDSTDLQKVLEMLKARIVKDRQRTQSPTVASPHSVPRQNGVHGSHATPQALRSKGPPPARSDISAVVFDFSGGNGDRYLFPKFSMLEFLPAQHGHQVIASFLIVRKGSTLEYGGDPELDYYQPITIRLSASMHRHLESLARVVAPPDEVRRYMDDVMSNMTRAEYVLLAMRLPRKDKEEKEATGEKETNGANGATPSNELQIRQVQPMQGVLWTAKASPALVQQKVTKKALGEDEQYQQFIATVTPRETEEA